MKVGDRIKVVADGHRDREPTEDNLIGWTGVITEIWPDGGVCVDLDPEQDPECALDQLAFAAFELEVFND